MMSNHHQVLLVILVLWGLVVLPVDVSGQEPSPTIPPPRIVSATPSGNIAPGVTPTPVVTPSSEMLPSIPLPVIVSATPKPSSGQLPLSSVDQVLLDTSVSNFFSADSFQFSFVSNVYVETDDEFASLQISGVGFIEGMTNPRNLAYQSQMRVNMQLNEEQQAIFIEQRITNGMFYFRGEDLSSGRETRWIGTRFSNLVENIFSSLLGNFSGLLGTGQPVPNDMELYEDLLKLLSFENFVSTHRMDSGNEREVWFETVIDIEGFLESPELMSSLLSVVAKLGAIDLGNRGAEQAAFVVGVMRRRVVPNLDLEISRFVDPASETLTRVEINFESWINFPTRFGLDSIPAQIVADVTLTFSNYESNFDVNEPENAYLTNNIFDLDAEDVVIMPGR